jgi:hypothetical protein
VGASVCNCRLCGWGLATARPESGAGAFWRACRRGRQYRDDVALRHPRHLWCGPAGLPRQRRGEANHIRAVGCGTRGDRRTSLGRVRTQAEPAYPKQPRAVAQALQGQAGDHPNRTGRERHCQGIQAGAIRGCFRAIPTRTLPPESNRHTVTSPIPLGHWVSRVLPYRISPPGRRPSCWRSPARAARVPPRGRARARPCAAPHRSGGSRHRHARSTRARRR